MQIVIDIPDKYDVSKIQNGSIASKKILDAVKNGKPLDTVLDEIRAEFKSKADGDDWYHTTDGLVWGEAIEIIDKYRGEQK
jgi:hypothetical protein